MKLRNKKTGEIDDVSITHSANKIKGVVEHEDGVQCLFAYTLKEFNEEWEDYETPKTHWYIYGAEPFEVDEDNWDKDFVEELKSIGNYFETKEEAEKAVEKLKAWKRLKDKYGFAFNGVVKDVRGKLSGVRVKYDNEAVTMEEARQAEYDIAMLFGGEEQ